MSFFETRQKADGLKNNLKLGCCVMKIDFEKPHKKEKFEDGSTLLFMAEMLAQELVRISDLTYKEALQLTFFWVKGTKVPNRPVKVTVPELWKARKK